MLRRFARFNSPENVRELEVSKLSWRDIGGQLVLLQNNLDKVQARLKHYDGLVTAHKGKLKGDEDSLSVDKVYCIAKQFRADTREYTAALEDILDLLEQLNITVSTALDQNGTGTAATGSDEELLVKQRLSLSRLVVDHWVRLRKSYPPILQVYSSDSSSIHSDLRNGNAPEKPKRKLWFKLMKRKVSPDVKSKEEEDSEDSEGVTGDKKRPLGLTDESTGVPNGRTSSIGDGGKEVSSSRCGVGRSSSQNEGVREASSGAGGSDNRDRGVACEVVVADQGSGNQMNQSEASVSFLSFHSANSGDEADCESETTKSVACKTTNSNNGNGSGYCNSISNANSHGIEIPNGKINANGITNADDDVNCNGIATSNAQISMQSTASQTDEGWIAWDSVELDGLDKQSSWSVPHELLRQQVLLRRELQQHAARLEALQLTRLHLPAETWLLCAQLHNLLRTVGSEVRAAQHSLRVRASALHLLDSSDCRSEPRRRQQQPPQPPSVKNTQEQEQQQEQQLPPSPSTIYQQLMAEASAITDTNTVIPVETTPPQQQQQLLPQSPSTIYQQLLVEASAITDTNMVPDVRWSPMWEAMNRAFDFLHNLSKRN